MFLSMSSIHKNQVPSLMIAPVKYQIKHAEEILGHRISKPPKITMAAASIAPTG